MKMRELHARTESDPYLIPVAQIKCAALTLTVGVLHPPYTFSHQEKWVGRLQVTWLIDKSLADDARLTLFIIPDVRTSPLWMLAAHLALLPRWPSKGLYLGLRVRSPLLSLLQMAEPHTWVPLTRRNWLLEKLFLYPAAGDQVTLLRSWWWGLAFCRTNVDWWEMGGRCEVNSFPFVLIA